MSDPKVEGTCRPTMGGWRRNIYKKRGKMSQTPGSTKGDNCQATGLDRLMAKRNRSWKHPLYAAWCRKKRG